MGLTQELAAWVAGLSVEAIPDATRERVKDIVLDTFASALAGQDASEVVKIERLAAALGQGEVASVIGGGRSSLAGATLLNSYLTTAVTVCDIHRPTTCHVTPEVVAPALAVGERDDTSGAVFLAAVAAGLEVTTRVGLGLRPADFRARGWHAPGVTGTFGGAASAGRVLGLSAQQQTWAFGLAGSQAAGTYAQLGTPTIKFQQSRGAHGGLMSALLASDSFAAAEDILAAPDGGLFASYSGGGDPAAVVGDLGSRWELEQISLRAWPVAVHLQPVVTGILDLLPAVSAGSVSRVRVGISETAFRMHGRMPWDDRFRARLSAPYVTGAALMDGRCWLDQFTVERVREPDLNAFIRERVVVEPEPGRADGTASIELEAGGRVERREVTASKGEPSNALTRDEIRAKFRAAAAPHLSAAATDEAIEMVTALETLPSLRTLADRLRRSV